MYFLNIMIGQLKFNIKLFKVMGNVCCQTDIEPNPLEELMPHFKDYQEAQWDDNDQVMLQWKNKLSNSDQKEEQTQEYAPKLLKHKTENRYYIGEWDQEGHPTGIGQIYQPSKIFFDGEFKDGYPEGSAEISFLDKKCKYNGNLKEGKANGKGTFRNQDKRYKLEGMWDDSRLNQGKIIFDQDPNMLMVTFQKLEDRTAIIHYLDSRVYKGEISWNKVVPDGQGTVTFPDKSKKVRYEGEWFMGQIHGKGVMEWKDGTIYDGYYAHGRKQGKGKFTFPSKASYDGDWQNGKQHGLGVTYNKNGEEEKRGIWQKGSFVKALTQQQFAAEINKQTPIESDMKGQTKSEKQQQKEEEQKKQLNQIAQQPKQESSQIQPTPQKPQKQENNQQPK